MALGQKNNESILAGTWLQQTAADFSGEIHGLLNDEHGIRLQSGFATGTYLSPVKATPFPFIALGLRWGTSGEADPEIEIRTSRDGATWSAWSEIEPNELRRPGIQPVAGMLYFVTEEASYFQYRLTFRNSKSLLRSVESTYIDSRPGPTAAEARSVAQQQPHSVSQPAIINRAGWGANESYRYDQNGEEIWPPEYRTVVKLIVHHTETSTYASDPAVGIRAVYYYHAVTLGWGDIGYNFLVDIYGYIYEGRVGGPGVVAGHALQYNWGSAGIAALGSFSSVQPGTSQIEGLLNILTWLADLHTIDPTGSGFFIDKNLPHLMGHRDCIATGCPGNQLYARLPDMRITIYNRLNADQTPPTVSIANLASHSNATGIFVHWQGSDSQSSITGYDLQVQANGGNWINWLMGTNLTSANYNGGTNGYAYRFRVRARDSANNLSGWVETGNSTLYDGNLPTARVLPPSGQISHTWFVVSWSCEDATSGIAGTDIQVSETPGNDASWWTWQSNVRTYSSIFMGAAGHTYYFRARARDNAGNTGLWQTSSNGSPVAYAAYTSGFDPSGLAQRFLPVIARSATLGW